MTIIPQKKHNLHNHLAIILGTVGGATIALIMICLSVFIYVAKKRYEGSHFGSTYSLPSYLILAFLSCVNWILFWLLGEQTDMRNWGAEKVFSYKEIKVATSNFKEVIGRGSFGSVYLGKLPDGKSVAVKVRFDKSQLGVDSFINEVH